jgi:hypothetical protein
VLAGDHHVPFLLRHVEDAIDVLAAHPPAGTGTVHDVVVDLHRRLAAIGGPVGRAAAEPRLRVVPRVSPATVPGRGVLRVAGR